MNSFLYDYILASTNSIREIVLSHDNSNVQCKNYKIITCCSYLASNYKLKLKMSQLFPVGGFLLPLLRSLLWWLWMFITKNNKGSSTAPVFNKIISGKFLFMAMNLWRSGTYFYNQLSLSINLLLNICSQYSHPVSITRCTSYQPFSTVSCSWVWSSWTLSDTSICQFMLHWIFATCTFQ